MTFLVVFGVLLYVIYKEVGLFTFATGLAVLIFDVCLVLTLLSVFGKL